MKTSTQRIRGALCRCAFVFVLCSTSAYAELNPVCHTLYEQFNLPNLTYENVGRIADMMHENKCWPVL